MVRPKGWRVSGRNGEGEGKGWKENEKRKSIGIRTSGRDRMIYVWINVWEIGNVREVL